MIKEPFSDIYGEPVEAPDLEDGGSLPGMGWCPYKECNCPAWDNGCQAEFCFVED